jgi:4-diphosphocytidyl-2-C-methyl-D-erythritol kinase
LQALIPDLRTGHFHLLKRLPAAAGIGGGSSDAAAALRLLARLNEIPLNDPRLYAAAGEIGSDVPVCLDPHARMMLGRGDELGARLVLPPLFAVLLNPGIALETRRVFHEMGYAPGDVSPFGQHPDIGLETYASLSAKLKLARNDMEDAASVLASVIGHALSVLGAAPGASLARMSGSGSTCFALFADCRAAARAAKAIRRHHPEWWAKATLLR